jgi:hypothetical protein
MTLPGTALPMGEDARFTKLHPSQTLRLSRGQLMPVVDQECFCGWGDFVLPDTDQDVFWPPVVEGPA